MTKQAKRLLAVQELALREEGYHALLEEHRILVEQLAAMTEAQREAVEDYLGLVTEIQNRLLLLACSLDES